jgi:hypothetical protein
MQAKPPSNVLHLQQRASKAGRTFAPIIAQKDTNRQELHKKRRRLVQGLGRFLLAGVAWTLILAGIGLLTN